MYLGLGTRASRPERGENLKELLRGFELLEKFLHSCRKYQKRDQVGAKTRGTQEPVCVMGKGAVESRRRFERKPYPTKLKGSLPSEQVLGNYLLKGLV